MAKEQSKYPEEQEAARFAALCCAASGQQVTDMNVAAMAAQLDGVISDESTAVQLLRSVKIFARIVSIEFEEKSRRYVIEYMPVNSKTGEVETVRSNRVDSRNGKAVKSIWGRDLVGHEVLLYKTNEAVGRDVQAAQGYRISPWCRDFGKADGAQK